MTTDANTQAHCPTCGRPRGAATGDPNSLCVSLHECLRQGDDICFLINQRNTLIAALRRALARPRPNKEQIRTIGVILESIAPSPTWCPRCHRVNVVVDNVVKVHPIDGLRVCGASTKRVYGGVEVDDDQA